MDLLPTALSVAGLDLKALIPADRAIDGIDLSPILRGDADAKGHAAYFYYSIKGAGPVGAEVGKDKLRSGLSAVRVGSYKAHYQSSYGAKKGVAALYDVSADDHERTPLLPSDARYAGALAAIDAARATHLASLVFVPNQNARGSSDALKFCGDPHSRTKFPTLPNCTLNPEVILKSDVCCLLFKPYLYESC